MWCPVPLLPCCLRQSFLCAAIFVRLGRWAMSRSRQKEKVPVQSIAHSLTSPFIRSTTRTRSLPCPFSPHGPLGSSASERFGGKETHRIASNRSDRTPPDSSRSAGQTGGDSGRSSGRHSLLVDGVDWREDRCGTDGRRAHGHGLGRCGCCPLACGPSAVSAARRTRSSSSTHQ